MPQTPREMIVSTMPSCPPVATCIAPPNATTGARHAK